MFACLATAGLKTAVVCMVEAERTRGNKNKKWHARGGDGRRRRRRVGRRMRRSKDGEQLILIG